MVTNEQIHDFISKYFTIRGEQVERKSWIRFKNAAADTADTSGVSYDMHTLAALFKAYTGNNPSYELGKGMNEQRREECMNKCFKIANALTHDPTSFTDLYNNGLAHDGAPDDICDSAMRKCFKAMAERDLIKSIEVKTCGKCCIRLYYL